MAIVRSLQNGTKVTDWTEEVVNLPVLSGMVNAMNLFDSRSSAATSITFTKSTRSYQLLPTTDRRARETTTGKRRTNQTFALNIPYINHQDTLTTEDILEYREWNDPNAQMSEARAKAAIVEDMGINGDQTEEFLKLMALKGIIADPNDGSTIVDMYTELGVGAQDAVDFTLGTTGTDISAKIATVIRTAAANNRTGMAIQMPIVFCGQTFWDKFVSHADVVGAWEQYLNAGVQRNRDNLFDFTKWGALGYFEHRGMIFVNYAPSFTAGDGSTVTPIAATEGYTIFPQARDLYRGYNGPSNKWSKIGQPGAPRHMYEWPQDKDNGIDFEMEMSPLRFMTNPKMSIRLHTSN